MNSILFFRRNRMDFTSVTNVQISNQTPVTVSKRENTISPKTQDFTTALQYAGIKEREEKFTSMIDTIDKLKRNLEYDMSVDNLMKYKKELQSFVTYYTKNELKVQDVLLTDRKGYTKKMQVVKDINERLNHMTTNMLETHIGHLQMLKEIGQVQGLILNLYI